jgi:hypothetical protein
VNPPLTTYLPALLLTWAVELPLLLLILRGRAPWRRVLLAGALGTALTHPQLWYLWPHLFDSYTAYIVCGELAVVAIETVVMAVACRKHFGPLMALGGVGLANAGSYFVGAMLGNILQL